MWGTGREHFDTLLLKVSKPSGLRYGDVLNPAWWGQTMKVYGDIVSGNCYKVKLVLAMLGISHDWIHIDIMAGETTNSAFLKRHPLGKIPLLETPSGEFLSESNAIINYLAAGTPLVGQNAFSYAKIQQWQFFEQYSHEPYIAVARFINKYLGCPTDRQQEFAAKQAGGHRALGYMDHQLSMTPFLTGAVFTTADIALYAYTHVAHEGGFALSGYPALGRWLSLVAAQPGYISMHDAAREQGITL